MSEHKGIKRGMYFEEFLPGMKFTTAGRTITEADVVNFAGLSGDFNQIHTDAEYSKTTPYGKRIGHGLLGLSIFTGLIAQTGVMEGTVIAFREIRNWKFVKPMYFGDTIHGELEIVEGKAIRRIGGGAIEIKVNIVNQSNDVIMRGVLVLLVASRP